MYFSVKQLLTKTAALSFGALLVIYLFTNPFTETKSNDNHSKGTEQTQKGDHSQEILVSSDWVTSVTTLQVQPVLKWIRDINLPENPLVHVFEIIKKSSTSFFQTLFQQIISPNAP